MGVPQPVPSNCTIADKTIVPTWSQDAHKWLHGTGSWVYHPHLPAAGAVFFLSLYCYLWQPLGLLANWLLLAVKQLCSLATNTSCQSTDHRLCISGYNLVSEVMVKLHVCKNQGPIKTSWILIDLPTVADYCPAFSKTANFECQSFIWIGNPPTNTMFGTCVCLSVCMYAICIMDMGIQTCFGPWIWIWIWIWRTAAARSSIKLR